MSRHDVPARAPDLTVVVGWDGPLQTYFAQVHRQIPGAGQSKIVLWIGTQQREIAARRNWPCRSRPSPS